MRVMIVQDRNFNNILGSGGHNVSTVNSLVYNLFGLGQPSGQISGTYAATADYTLLPINPQEPGRFNVVRDFRMSIAPGWKNDYYRKIYIRQRHMNSRGRIYFGDGDSATE